MVESAIRITQDKVWEDEMHLQEIPKSIVGI